MILCLNRTESREINTNLNTLSLHDALPIYAVAGKLTVAFSKVEWNEEGMTARFDSRTPLCTTDESLSPATNFFARHGIALTGELEAAHHVDANSDFVQTLLGCYEAYTGEKGYCESMGGGTYVHGIPGGVAFGAMMPGFDCGLHGPDEKISLSHMLTACKIFTQAIVQLCG